MSLWSGFLGEYESNDTPIPWRSGNGFSNAMPMPVDLLTIPRDKIRLAAAQKIWEAVSDTNLVGNGLYFALCQLRNEIQGTELVPQLSPETALQAFWLLRNVCPERLALFNRCLMLAWCYGDPVWANYGHRLLDIYDRHHTFLDGARETSVEVGRKLGKMGLGAMRVIHEAITLALGQSAADELSVAWRDVGGN